MWADVWHRIACWCVLQALTLVVSFVFFPKPFVMGCGHLLDACTICPYTTPLPPFGCMCQLSLPYPTLAGTVVRYGHLRVGAQCAYGCRTGRACAVRSTVPTHQTSWNVSLDWHAAQSFMCSGVLLPIPSRVQILLGRRADSPRHRHQCHRKAEKVRLRPLSHASHLGHVGHVVFCGLGALLLLRYVVLAWVGAVCALMISHTARLRVVLDAIGARVPLHPVLTFLGSWILALFGLPFPSLVRSYRKKSKDAYALPYATHSSTTRTHNC